MLCKEKHLRLPQWLNQQLSRLEGRYPSAENRMDLAISLARQNVEQGKGGPFGAAVFHLETGELVAVGVNQVVEAGCSLAHAEIMALALAQEKAGGHDLAAPPLPLHQLVTSAEPCSMCLGAIHWSGVKSVLMAARDEDVRAIGFDEGFKPIGWIERFHAAGIEVVADLGRQQAIEVLRHYREKGGSIYNPGK